MLIRTVLGALTLLAAGCASGGSSPLPEGDPTIAGPIVARDVRSSISGDRPTVHVKESADEECGIIFTLTPETEIVRRTAAGAPERGAVDDLVPGRTARVWSDGPILESCPAQAGARAVEVLVP